MVARRLSGEFPAPTIPAFYAGKSVFITGATGFMGKVLIERILATCPNVGCLYLLMREKKDQSPEKRLLQLKQSQVFDVLRRTQPAQLDKLRSLSGDTSREQLGMDSNSLQQLREVSIVFHVAATLKFDEELRKAVEENLRSIMRLLNICDSLPHIEALVHVSTAYCMAELAEVEERVYTPIVPLPTLEALVDHADEAMRQQLVQLLLGDKPNTYTFTKAMAEHAVVEHKAQYPVAIFRPTVVISSLRSPVPGWIEYLNGPSGVVVGAGKGLLHTFRCTKSARADLLPVDIAIGTMITCAWDVATNRQATPRVYNCSTYENPTTWSDFERCIRKEIIEQPLDAPLWYPCAFIAENKYVHKLYELVLQTGPLHLAEWSARAVGMKPKINLITVSRKLRAMSDVLMFFSLREWRFRTENVQRLRDRLSPQDAAIYNLDVNTIDWRQHMKNFMMGVRKYLLKEKDQDIEAAKKHLRKMYWVHTGVKLLLLGLTLRLLLRGPAAQSLAGALRLLLSLCTAVYSRLLPAA
uniref:Fatty acyl-CoA reductase n=1 Tax=Yponomeuta evonymella TaxID=2567737 RepID=D7P5E4_YPOEV|nr:fatty-acyl CoA reductase III [Yponomeuta evonymella]